MKVSNYTVNIIEPNDGFYLTNKENPGDILSKKVFLAANYSAENCVESSIEEGDALHAQIIKERESQEENVSLN